MIQTAAEFIELRSRNDLRASSDSAPDNVWLEIVQAHPEMKEWVVNNKTVPISILTLLAEDHDPHVRFCVAMKRKCPPEVLEKLARDPDEPVRSALRQTPRRLNKSCGC